MNYISNRIGTMVITMAALCTFASCSDFLDGKPEQSMVIPSSYADLQALLDDDRRMNSTRYVGLLEIGTDDFYVDQSVLDAQQPFERDCYIWHPNPIYSQSAMNQQWTHAYGPISVANVVLEQLDGIHKSDEIAYRHIKGAALFYRGYSHYTLAQAYSLPYNPLGENQHTGLPLRLTSDLDVVSVRSTVEDTYSQIIEDLTTALDLLPEKVEFATRPSKPAAAAALARTYLSMEDYGSALHYAELALGWHDDLIDYNMVDENLAMPFVPLNEETIFFATSSALNLLHPARLNISTSLHSSYSENDRRKSVFFSPNLNNTYSFKGTYTGFIAQSFFAGLASPELYLIVSECLVRAGQSDQAVTTLRRFMSKRYEPGFSVPSFLSDDDMLAFVLEERRKEMVFRGTRWTDLRRLNRDSRFRKTLSRIVVENGERVVYTLPPGDPRYTYLIPQDVIDITGMPQNPR